MRYGMLFGQVVGWAVFVLELLLVCAASEMLLGTHFGPPRCF